MLHSHKSREKELKNRVATDVFHKYDCNEIIKDIDKLSTSNKLKIENLYGKYIKNSALQFIDNVDSIFAENFTKGQ
jgi:hypothetical protein